MGTILGPITEGGLPPWSAPVVDFEARSFVMEEFFIEGSAVAYEPEAGSELSADGRFRLREAETAPFRTRFLVVRPRDPAAFNGTVFLNWQNVTGGYEAGAANEEEIYRSGAAWVGVSAQRVGMEGFPGGVSPFGGGAPPGQHLKLRDPDRYGSLQHPGDRWSYDMFTQVARAVGPDRDRGGLDPMAGLAVRHVIGTGASQSAARLLAYVNGVHPLAHALHGYLPTIGGFVATAFTDDVSGNTPTAALGLRTACVVRDDLDVPAFWVNSETEVLSRASVPIPVRDTDHFRLWEVAGTPHYPRPDTIDFGDGWQNNRLPYAPVVTAAFRQMQRWLTEGTPPPSIPYIVVAGDPPEIVRDQHGNAVGGVRLPEVEAPTMAHEGFAPTEGLGRLVGRARPLPPEVLASLYADEQAYANAYATASDAAVAAGTLLPEDADRLKAAAAGQGEAVAWPDRGLG
jgi:hypothetical protein